VGGRLDKLQLDYCQKHPVLLPPSHIAQLIMEDIHHKVSHEDDERTLSDGCLIKQTKHAIQVTGHHLETSSVME